MSADCGQATRYGDASTSNLLSVCSSKWVACAVVPVDAEYTSYAVRIRSRHAMAETSGGWHVSTTTA
ncbi:hypothetical protein GN958_ATG22256 [Phytophthora infestans]|uniref:Uncharacterized protein n=1 Tax=Phytophthora infestans TaxID=4787 RepID=A0A8S9TKP1_PHYIN|nr:hypothetical protein GN958_ATG22256 [Phytophthora infestans]